MFRSPTRAIFFILLVLFAVPQYAQISLGVNAGLTRMKFSGDSPSGIGFFSPQPGYSSSLALSYRFKNGFGLNVSPGLNVLRSKYSFFNDSATRVVDSTYYTFKTFSLPLNAIVWSPSGRFYVLAGIEFSYELDFEGEIQISQTQVSNPSYEVADYLIYAHFGAGFIIPLGRPFLSFELKYSQGLNDMTTPLVHNRSELPRTKLTNIYLLLGFHIPLGDPDVFSVKKKHN